jgi:acetyl-CoA C-acetyltransferase
MRKVVLTEGLRTPFGRFGGKLAGYSAVELGVLATKAMLARADVDPADIDESLFGTAMLAASTSVAARQINVRSGIPARTPSLTIDRACCSSMTCVGLGMAKIRSADADLIIAGGIESASQTPFLMRGVRWGHRLGDFAVEDPMQMRNPINGQPITVVTGHAALSFGVDRTQQDDWAFDSHRKYFAALDAGVYADEIIAVSTDRQSEEMLTFDESARRTVSRDKLATLPTAYGSPTVTAGNAPGLNDGAATLLLMSGEEAARRGVAGLAEIVSYAQVCGEPDSSVYMPGLAIQRALEKAGVALRDLKRIEINEAFAAMPLVSTLELAQGDAELLRSLRAMTNVNGGSVALGHPTGASGARVVMSLARELRRIGGGYGAAAICGGYGQADAVILKV